VFNLQVSEVRYLFHRLSCGFSRNETLGYAHGSRHLLLGSGQQRELQTESRWSADSGEDGTLWHLTETPYLSEVDHPVGFALLDQVVRGHQVDQVQVAVEQQTLQTFGQVFVQHVTVGQIHRA